MEDFGSIDREALSYIKEVIDQCDYYVLIIAGRYGSVDESGISYTEQEYDYAVSKAKTVLVFIRKDISKIPIVDVDTERTKKNKLKKFREKVSKGRLVSYWDDPKVLITDVMIALGNAFRSHPGIGWIRANSIKEGQAVEIERLQYENQSLRAENARIRSELISNELDLESHLNIYSIVIEYFGRRGSQERTVYLSWAEIFMIIGPIIKINTDIKYIRYKISSIIASVLQNEGEGIDLSEISDQSFETIMSYFVQCGFIEYVNDATVLMTRVGRRFLIEYSNLSNKIKPNV